MQRPAPGGRSEAVPTRAPCGRAARRRRRAARSTRRADPRAAASQRIARPSGSKVGMSFMECTAMSISPVEQRLLDLLGEQALAADLGERPVLDAVAGGADHHDARSVVRPAWAATSRRARMGLGQRQRTAAGADERDAASRGLRMACRSLVRASICLGEVRARTARPRRSAGIRGARPAPRSAGIQRTLPCSSSASRPAATKPPPPWSTDDRRDPVPTSC